MDIKKLKLIPRVIEAVQFTGDNREELRTWVQDALTFQQVTATPERLYLPTVAGMEVLEVGDWVFYDRMDSTFRGATDAAVQVHYREVEASDDPQEV